MPIRNATSLDEKISLYNEQITYSESVVRTAKANTTLEYATRYRTDGFERNMDILKKAWFLGLVPVVGWVPLVTSCIKIWKASKRAAWFLKIDIIDTVASAKQEISLK